VKTLRRLLLWLLLVVALAAAGVLLTRTEPPLVVVHTVGRGAVEATVSNTRAGTVTANRRAKLAPTTGGIVQRLLVREGERVAKGQVLMELWHDDLTAQLALATTERDRAAAMAEEALLRAELAEREAQRQVELAQQRISSPDAVDRLVSAAKALRAAQGAAAAQAASAGKQIEVIEAQIRRMTVQAPFDGIVAEVNGEVGEFVTPSPVGIPTPPAVDLIDAGVPYVTAPIDEVDAARVSVGMPARITLDAFGKRTFPGRVRRIAPYVMEREKQARTVDVEVEFAPPTADVALLPGYSADVEIVLACREDVLRVPTESLREGGVLVVAPDGVLAARSVELGLTNWRFSEVVTGLAEGERIVASFDTKGLVDGIGVRTSGGQRP
jgi:HlyD family secretion protein